MSQMGPLRYKVVVLGEAGVGKSSLTVRLANGVFPESLETTTGGMDTTHNPFFYTMYSRVYPENAGGRGEGGEV